MAKYSLFMTQRTWNELATTIANGDPIKDVCDEDALVEYILELRKRLKLKENEV